MTRGASGRSEVDKEELVHVCALRKSSSQFRRLWKIARLISPMSDSIASFSEYLSIEHIVRVKLSYEEHRNPNVGV